MLELASNYGKGTLQLEKVARQQEISIKYLEQIIIPLKKAGYVKSVRGSKGGHLLARDPQNITIGEIIDLLEGGKYFTKCAQDPKECERADTCPTRSLWMEAADSMFEKLNSVTLYDLMKTNAKM